MTYHNLKLAIEMVKSGKTEEGARLLRFALRGDDLKPDERVVAWLWLAETTDQIEAKIGHYQAVLQIQPDHPQAQEMLRRLSQIDLPPVPPKTPPPPPQHLPQQTVQQTVQPVTPPPPAQMPEQPHATWSEPQQMHHAMPADEANVPTAIDYNNLPRQASPTPPRGRVVGHQAPSTGQVPAQTASLHRTVGIFGGLNGDGTGFFVTPDGIVATTRHVVGGDPQVSYEISGGRRGKGVVVRSFPQYDLAFVQTGLRVGQLLPISSAPIIADNTPITAITYNKRTINGQKRATTSTFKPEWFPTTIDTMGDAGGNPIFNDRGLLVGMLTANANRSAPYVFGLYIKTIFDLLEQYQAEMREHPISVYCGGCGGLSVAGNYGGFYCEHCGTILPHAQGGKERFVLPQMAKLYGETMSPACVICGSTSGYHRGKCLRCGHQYS